MSDTSPGAPTGRKLLRASDAVMTRIEEQVTPPQSRPRMALLAATFALVLTWPQVFMVFLATTIVAPSVTNGAGGGTVAFWALLVALLTSLTAVARALIYRPTPPDQSEPESVATTVGRISVKCLLTAVCVWLVLTPQGLSSSQIAILTVLVVVMTQLVPVALARLLVRLRRSAQS